MRIIHLASITVCLLLLLSIPLLPQHPPASPAEIPALSDNGATVTSTEQFLGITGAVGTPTYSFSCGSCASSGLYSDGFGALKLSAAGVDQLQINNGSINTRSAVPYGFTSGGSVGGSADTAISRDAASVVDIGNGTQGDTTGRLKAAGFMSAGTKFTSNAGCTEGTLVGGATVGKFTVGQATACTIIITMGNTATAPNGWTCVAYDQTAVPAVAIRQTASTTTTCSLLMTVATNDVITFLALGF